MTDAASPCVNVCVLDAVTGYCIGCGRTGDEIARWIGMTDDERRALNATLPERLRHMTSRAARQTSRQARLGGRRARTPAG